MHATLNDIDLSDLDNHQASDTEIQSRKTVVKLGAGFQAFHKKPVPENTVIETMAARADNDHDPRQTRELDADNFFSLGKFTI